MIIAMVSIPAENKTFKVGGCISALIHCERNPTHLVALAALLVRRMGRAYADPVAQLGGES
jgi:hypothetical protein